MQSTIHSRSKKLTQYFSFWISNRLKTCKTSFESHFLMSTKHKKSPKYKSCGEKTWQFVDKYWQMLVCLTIARVVYTEGGNRDQWLVSKPERGYVAATDWGRQPLLTEAMPVPHWGLIHNWGLHRLRVSETTRPFLGRPAQPGHHLPTQALSPLYCGCQCNVFE